MLIRRAPTRFLRGPSRWKGRVFTAGLLCMASCVQQAAALESRSYVVSWFGQAVSNTDDDCPDGINPDVGEQYRRNLIALGKSPEEAEELMRRFLAGGDAAQEVSVMLNDRGRIDGKPVNAYAHPEAVIDPKLNWLKGQYAYGFDLDGKGADDPDGFVDPETRQPGIDNQYFRALGCSRAFRGTVQNPSAYWAFVWTTVKDTMPAWLITLRGEDLDRDGPVTVIFDRALEYAKSNPDGKTRPYMTYRVDPDPRSHNVFRGRIDKGVVSITEHGDFFMLQSALYAPEIVLRNTHLRMNLRADGTMDGFLGGYQPWHHIYFGIAHTGLAGESTVTGELPGLYYLFKRHADADPDPQTGQNMSISAVYRLEAVPAFAAASDGSALRYTVEN